MKWKPAWEKLFMSSVEFQKAFDCVTRKKLMTKLCPSDILAVLIDKIHGKHYQNQLGSSLTREIQQKRVPEGDRFFHSLLFFLADLSESFADKSAPLLCRCYAHMN